MKTRLHGGVLLGVEPGELVGNLRERALARGLEGLQPRLHTLEAGGEAIEQRRRIEPVEPALDRIDLRLERTEPGEDGLHRGILLAVEPGELVRDLREGVLARRLQRSDPVGERGGAGLRGGPEAVEPAFQPGKCCRGIAGLHLARQPVEPVGERLRKGRPVGLDRRDAGVERPGRAGGAAHVVQHAGGLGGARAQGRELLLQTRKRRGTGRGRGLDAGDPRLERAELLEHDLHGGVLLGVEPGELVGNLAEGIALRGLERTQPRLHAGTRLGFGVAARGDPGLQRLEQAARLGGIADLLEGRHAGAQLVEPGERGLERGVLVTDQPEHLAGHRLEPLLGRRLGGGHLGEPGDDLGLGAFEGGDTRHLVAGHRVPCPGLPAHTPGAAAGGGHAAPGSALAAPARDEGTHHHEHEACHRKRHHAADLADSEDIHIRVHPMHCSRNSPHRAAEAVNARLTGRAGQRRCKPHPAGRGCFVTAFTKI